MLAHGFTVELMVDLCIADPLCAKLSLIESTMPIALQALAQLLNRDPVGHTVLTQVIRQPFVRNIQRA